MKMKCIDASTIECRAKTTNRIPAHISTFEDGSTDVLCPGKDETDTSKCSLLQKKCIFVREAIDCVLKREKPTIQNVTLTDAIDIAQKITIENALAATNGDTKEACKILKISPTTLWRKQVRYGIPGNSK